MKILNMFKIKTYRLTRRKFSSVMFTNDIVNYGKNAKGLYRIETNITLGFLGDGFMKIYQGKRKPLFKSIYILSLLTALISPLVVISLIICFPIRTYIIGMRNFIKDSVRNDGVRAFNWVNICVIGLLTIALILK